MIDTYTVSIQAYTAKLWNVISPVQVRHIKLNEYIEITAVWLIEISL